jgi:hypothetical protein
MVAAAVGLAVAGNAWLKAVWGDCHSVECAYLPVPVPFGALAIAAVYVTVIGVAAWQLWQSPVVHLGRPMRWLGPGLLSNRAFYLLLLGILALAAFLRFDRLDLTSFTADQSRAARIGYESMLEGRLSLVGIVSSQRVPNPPGHSYLLAPAAALGRDPWLIAAWTTLLGLVTVALTAVIGRRWFGPAVGLLGALLVAVGYWSYRCSTMTWGPCTLPPLALLLLDALLLLAVFRQPWALVAAAFWAAVSIHLHFLGAVYFLAVAVAAAMAWRTVRPQHLVSAALAVVVVLLPILVWELTPNVRFVDVRRVLVANSAAVSVFDAAAIQYLGELAGAGGIERLFYPNEATFLATMGPWPPLAGAGTLLTALGFGLCLAPRRPPWLRWVPALALVSLVVLPALPLIRHSIGIQAHYLYGVLPPMALLSAIAACWLADGWSQAPGRRRAASRLRLARVASAMLLVAVYGGASIGSIERVNAAVQEIDNDVYGVSGRFTRAATLEAVALWRSVGSPHPIFLGGLSVEGDPYEYQFEAFPEIQTVLFDDCHWMPEAAGAGPAVVLVRTTAAPAASRIERLGEAVSTRRHLARIGETRIGLYVVDGTALRGQEIPLGEAEEAPACYDRVIRP